MCIPLVNFRTGSLLTSVSKIDVDQLVSNLPTFCALDIKIQWSHQQIEFLIWDIFCFMISSWEVKFSQWNNDTYRYGKCSGKKDLNHDSRFFLLNTHVSLSYISRQFLL